MNFKVPMPLVRAWFVFCDWGNAPVWRRIIRGYDAEIVRLDILLALGFVLSVCWYGYLYGWRGAVQGGVMCIVVAAFALFVRR